MEYGVEVVNKYAFISDDEVEDPSDLIRKAEKERKSAAQIKAERELERIAKEKAEAARKAATAANLAAAGKDTRPGARGRGRGRGGAGFRGPRPEGAEGQPREGGEFRGRGRGRGGPRPPFRGRGGNAGSNAGHPEGDNKEVTDNGFVSAEGGENQARRAPARGGFSRGGRGGFRGAGREFDRHSGSDRTGIKGVEKKDGHGRGNWGTEADELAGQTEEVKLGSSDEAENAPPVPVEKSKEQLELEAIEAEIAKQKTLAEYRASLQVDSPVFNARQAGEGGEDDFGTLRPLHNKKEVKSQAKPKLSEPVKSEAARVKTIPIDFRFTDSHRGDRRDTRGGPRGRGTRGGGGGRGGFDRGTGGRSRAAPTSTAFNASDDSAFPALGAH